MTFERHFTATGFVVQDGATLLHWHAKLRAWMPPGGHVMPNEDPVEAVLREVEEETGLQVEIVPVRSIEWGLSHPTLVSPPLTIMVEDIDDPVDGPHHHIDFIYVCRPMAPVGDAPDGWRWVTRDDLAAGAPIARDGAPGVPPPDDVRLLATDAFRVVEDSDA